MPAAISPQPRYASHPYDFQVVAIGVSAGGLEACRNLLAALPPSPGMAFILVQHLDPTHESMMVNLLSGHTSLPVCLAEEGMLVLPNTLYVIPPSFYLAIANRTLHLSVPTARHGARLPFDFLLHSLAVECGPKAVCIVLSGTGADGSLGLPSVREHGGLVIAQDPEEAAYNGMPLSAIGTHKVSHVLGISDMPHALMDHVTDARPHANGIEPMPPSPALADIVALLRVKTSNDFTHYKQGTLLRRIERRMALNGLTETEFGRYIEILNGNAKETKLLAKDLLIHVTKFFRDQKVFDVLAKDTLPELVRAHPADRPLRVWIPGCSTGEEAYSLTILLQEIIDISAKPIKLQVFASDLDPDAIIAARDGVYPETISEDVNLSRLERYFTREGKYFRINRGLRESVVFTVHDVLSDPPFSRLDMISCRNLMIYLLPEAQAKTVAMFHFALRDGGILLLGDSETIANADGRFQTITESESIYRHIRRPRMGDLGFPIARSDAAVSASRAGKPHPISPAAAIAEFSRRVVMENYAPAAILINLKNECLYSLGSIDRYVRVVPGYPSNDLLAMVRQGLRLKLRAAIDKASLENIPVVITGNTAQIGPEKTVFNVDVHPLRHDGETLLLICFVEQSSGKNLPAATMSAPTEPLHFTLERELEATRAELQDAIRTLEVTNEDQRAIHEETLSSNEEYQSTNEELMTSKEELQSLNEELTALNGQLRETLDRQRTLSNDLKNVLYSKNVATIFLDPDLRIRLFTPTTKTLFNIIPSDIGRPLADLSARFADTNLLDEARQVLQDHEPIEHEILTDSGAWFERRILPYRTQENEIEGVVVTFTDTTHRHQISDALAAAKKQADNASTAKSRFLAAASHDLRQPLQTLALLQGQLAKAVEGDKAKRMVQRLDEMLGAMSGMLNTLLDINQIEAGTTNAVISDFPLADLLHRMEEEFTYTALTQGLKFRVVKCGLTVRSDPRLLEQMVRNLLSNALKYTQTGKVLLGCRHAPGMVSIEVWDTGIGIPAEEYDAIFDEYHQLDNPARERSRGLGLGLSIVQRVGNLLGHRVRVRSKQGVGSSFAIDVPLAPPLPITVASPSIGGVFSPVRANPRRGSILVIEDDPEVRELLVQMLGDEGHHMSMAADGVAAVALIRSGIARPDLILADYNLPNGLDGLQTIEQIREFLQTPIACIILTGDISISTLREIAVCKCVHINKPVKLPDLNQVIQRLLAASGIAFTAPPVAAANIGAAANSLANSNGKRERVFVVDDDPHVRTAITEVLEEAGMEVEAFASGEAFLAAYQPNQEACLLLDAYLPGISGLGVLQKLGSAGGWLQTIMITGDSDVAMAVNAMKAGACDFIEKPVSAAELVCSIHLALERAKDVTKRTAWHDQAAGQVANLTTRQHEIMDMVLAGHPSKNIAADLDISQRTVENHRAAIMRKTGTKSIPALARLAVAAGWSGAPKM